MQRPSSEKSAEVRSQIGEILKVTERLKMMKRVMLKVQAEHEIEQRHDQRHEREPHERHGRQGAASARVASRRGSAILMLSPRTLLNVYGCKRTSRGEGPGRLQHLASSQEDYATRTATDDIQYGCLLFQKNSI